jgi:serine/threonine protein kinase
MRKLAGRPRLQAISWLAPECFRGDGLSKHSDVYAFGILMWELYTGQVGTSGTNICSYMLCVSLSWSSTQHVYHCFQSM